MREHSSHDDSDSDSDVDALLDFPREPAAARSRGNGPNGPNGPSLAAVAEGDDAAIRDPPAALPSQQEDAHSRKPVAWSELPRKDQLVIITLARMSEPLVQTSLQVSLTQLLHYCSTPTPSYPLNNSPSVSTRRRSV